MRPFAPCLILLMAPMAAHASDALTSSGRGGCVYSPTDNERTPPASAAPAARAPATAKPAASGGTSSGGGGDDDVLPRLRAPKWHSFLPGMFR
ncbi:hypothetical protein [Stenotrophomonas rhizophila]|uniref:hypothetical protein n=1 Tax=Stenotrophomonas rhizophila TaxID=216778 RepID=UPI001E6065EA|nr:hypothetical protein [Stenotrophomonas rhizophila]MCC7633063.1 hypothetical protein [Stenotrophomonas rhizophila]MCC7661956.1 hypothetical protein [Stenotrophomonas rhizophila]